MPTKVISFGCKSPCENAALIDEQISKAHRYYNQLVELHRKQIDACEAKRRELFPDFAGIEKAVTEAEAEVEGAVVAIRAANARAKRKRATPEESAGLAFVKARLKDLRAKRKEMRAAIAENAELQTALATIYADASVAKKAARATCGVYWGSYLKIENAVETAIKKTIGPPKFKRWTGDGQVAVQVQLGASYQDMLACRGKIGGLIQASPMPTTRTSPRRARPWMFSIRVQSDEKRLPIWAKVMVYVQPDRIPDDAKIMGVSLVRRPLAPHRMSDGLFHQRYDWSLQFTIRTSEEKQRATSGACGIDLGWRLIDGQLRVAYLVGDDGHVEELRLPASLLARWGKSQSLQGIRDRNFDAAKAGLIEWKQSREALPEWFTEAAKTCGQWKAKGKLARLIDQWGKERIDGDGDVLAMLREWREQDVHLWQWQVDNERKAQRTRLHLYRVFAHKVARRYGSIAVEDCDWRQLARKPKADDNTHDGGVREYMRIASVSKLRELLKQSGGVMVDSKDTTRTCHACGSLEEWDQADDIVHTCSCGLPWDQDYNAAKNLLARLASGVVPAETPGIAREPESDGESEVADKPQGYVGRWAKRKANRSQNEAGEDAA